jgi:hypothetical protein
MATDDQPTELRIPCAVYSRVCGYLTAVEDWNPAKQQEFHDRQTFDVAGAPGCEHIGANDGAA